LALTNVQLDVKPDIMLNLEIGANTSLGVFTINGASFQLPNVPVLLQILSGAVNASQLLPKGDVYSFPPNKVVEVLIPCGSIAAPVS
jgi:iron transport multicopper oxidase